MKQDDAHTHPISPDAHPSELAKGHTRECVEFLVSTMRNQGAGHRERFGAAQQLLKLAWGGTPQGTKEFYEPKVESELDKFQHIIGELGDDGDA